MRITDGSGKDARGSASITAATDLDVVCCLFPSGMPLSSSSLMLLLCRRSGSQWHWNLVQA